MKVGTIARGFLAGIDPRETTRCSDDVEERSSPVGTRPRYILLSAFPQPLVVTKLKFNVSNTRRDGRKYRTQTQLC